MSGSGFSGEGDLLLLPPILKGQFLEAEPSDPIPNVWIWAVARSFAWRLL